MVKQYEYGLSWKRIVFSLLFFVILASGSVYIAITQDSFSYRGTLYATGASAKAIWWIISILLLTPTLYFLRCIKNRRAKMYIVLTDNHIEIPDLKTNKITHIHYNDMKKPATCGGRFSNVMIICDTNGCASFGSYGLKHKKDFSEISEYLKRRYEEKNLH